MDAPIVIIVSMILASWITAEAIKFIIDISINKRPDARIFLAYGGFPSAHSALVSSLCTAILLVQGFSIVFAASLVFALIVLRDTITLRRYIDRNTRQIVKLNKHLTREQIDFEYISHSLLEIIVGVAIGIVVPAIIFVIL